MKELKIGEVFMFLGTQYIVCGYRSSEGVIEGIDIWPFHGDPDSVADCNASLEAGERGFIARHLQNAFGALKKVIQ